MEKVKRSPCLICPDLLRNLSQAKERFVPASKKGRYYCIALDKYFSAAPKDIDHWPLACTYYKEIMAQYKTYQKRRCWYCKKFFRPKSPHIRFCSGACREFGQPGIDPDWLPLMEKKERTWPV